MLPWPTGEAPNNNRSDSRNFAHVCPNEGSWRLRRADARAGVSDQPMCATACSRLVFAAELQTSLVS